jgi:hypothetical protein
MDVNFFENDCKEKYYLLGWILSDGHVGKNNLFWSMQIHQKDKKMLEKILNLIKSKNNIHGPYANQPSVQIKISCKEHHQFLTQSCTKDARCWSIIYIRPSYISSAACK